MNIRKYQPHGPGNNEIESLLGTWSRAAAMLELTPELLRAFSYSIVAHDQEQLLGHIAITELNEGVATIGGLVVDPAYRKQRVGLALTEHILKVAADFEPVLQTCHAYANEASLSLFLKAGGVLIGSREQLAPTGCNYKVDLMPAFNQVTVW
jgi:N-acetylglutamate synthase-like GNAT family acetyltransferase